MGLSVTADHTELEAVLRRLLAADPVRNTIAGTMIGTLTDTAWAAHDSDRVAVRSAAEYPLLLAGDWSPDTLDELVPLVAQVPRLRAVSGAETSVAPLVARLRGDRPTRRQGQRLFRLDELTPPVGVPGAAVPAGPPHRAVVREWMAGFLAEAEPAVTDADALADRVLDAGDGWLWVDGEPVSLAARHAVAAGSARVGPVYTPPAARGHGYGSAVTAAVTRTILDERAVAVLFTDLDNPTSNKIYQRLGYRPVEDRVVVEF